MVKPQAWPEAQRRAGWAGARETGGPVRNAVNLRITDIEAAGASLRVRDGKGGKDRLVPLPAYALQELRVFWKTHRHPTLLFPGVGRGWRDKPESSGKLAQAVEPMGVGSVQTCLRHARADARLPKGTCVHTLRHSYATHLLDGARSAEMVNPQGWPAGRSRPKGERRGCPPCGRRRSQRGRLHPADLRLPRALQP